MRFLFSLKPKGRQEMRKELISGDTSKDDALFDKIDEAYAEGKAPGNKESRQLVIELLRSQIRNKKEQENKFLYLLDVFIAHDEECMNLRRTIAWLGVLIVALLVSAHPKLEFLFNIF